MVWSAQHRVDKLLFAKTRQKKVRLNCQPYFTQPRSICPHYVTFFTSCRNLILLCTCVCTHMSTYSILHFYLHMYKITVDDTYTLYTDHV